MEYINAFGVTQLRLGHMRFFRPVEVAIKEIPWIASQPFAGFIDPAAAAFCSNLMAKAYHPQELLKILPQHKLIYLSVPKSASTRIRRTMAKVDGRFTRSLKSDRRSKYRGPCGPRNMTAGAFFRLAIDAETLRFSFVRNPYARAVSCWSDKFAGKPLIRGKPYIDAYLAVRSHIDPALPAGADRALSFAEFTVFAEAAAKSRLDIHLQAQDDLLTVPGISLDLIGKVETFDADFSRVLDHLNASEAVRRDATIPINESHHDDWTNYYTPELADRIYRAYECDFDRFGYTRTIGNGHAAKAGVPKAPAPPGKHAQPTENALD